MASCRQAASARTHSSSGPHSSSGRIGGTTSSPVSETFGFRAWRGGCTYWTMGPSQSSSVSESVSAYSSGSRPAGASISVLNGFAGSSTSSWLQTACPSAVSCSTAASPSPTSAIAPRRILSPCSSKFRAASSFVQTHPPMPCTGNQYSSHVALWVGCRNSHTACVSYRPLWISTYCPSSSVKRSTQIIPSSATPQVKYLRPCTSQWLDALAMPKSRSS